MGRIKSKGGRRPWRATKERRLPAECGKHAVEEDNDQVEGEYEEMQEDTPVPDSMTQAPAVSAAPEQKDNENEIPMDGGAANILEVEGNDSVPDPVKEEPAPSAAPDRKGEVNEVGPMEEESAKNEKKRVREKEIEVEDESEKTSKAARTEDVDNSNPAARVEDEEGKPENGDGVEVVEGSVIGDDEPGKTKKLKKRKIAMIIAYCGANYQGMQRNPGAITIEGDLEQALYRAGAITKENFGTPRKVDWMRAARTDKGVSAVGQIVSGQFIIEPEGFVERVNSFLPRDIVVLGYKRVTASFNSKKLCDKRRYEYIIPTYCFDPSKHLDRDTANAVKAEGEDESVENDAKDGIGPLDGQKVVPPTGNRETGVLPEGKREPVDGETCLPSGVKVEPVNGEKGPPSMVEEDCIIRDTVLPVKEETPCSLKVKGEDGEGDVVVPNKVGNEPGNGEAVGSDTGKEEVRPVDKASNKAEVKKVVPYNFDEAELNRLNRILARYKGTHNYHNFTARTQAEDPSAQRFIISFEADDVITVDGIEFVRLHVVGQSFMLHQIRKMVGLAVAIMRGAAPVSVMDFALRKDTKFNVPMAPELGLFLEECYYSSYNNKFKSSHEELSLKDYVDAVKDFKMKVIYPHIAGTEARDQVFPLWVHGINDRHFPDFVAAREGTYKSGNRTAGNAA